MKIIERLVSTLGYERRYAEILDFVRPHLPLIEQVSLRRLPSQRLHDWIAAARMPRAANAAEHGQGAILPVWASGIAAAVGRGFMLPILKIVSLRKADVASADTIARSLYASPPLTEFIARKRPSFAPELLGRSLPHRFEFSNGLLERLMRERGSALYEELKDNQNLNRNYGYVIQERNFLLHSYFADANVARELGGVRAVGAEPHVALLPVELR